MNTQDDRVQKYREAMNIDRAALESYAKLLRVGIADGIGGVVAPVLATALEDLAKDMRKRLADSTRPGDPPLLIAQSIEDLADKELGRYDALRARQETVKRALREGKGSG
jgi:hypothetical protein